MSDRQARFQRRLAERREQQQEPEAIPDVPPAERRSFPDRRSQAMTSAEVDDWLKRNGISGGDRRKATRRKR
jgi:hypothetical protein